MSLERIYWDGNNFAKFKSETPVRVVPIGDPVTIYVGRRLDETYDSEIERVANKMVTSIRPSELPNAFSSGVSTTPDDCELLTFPIQYYKILKPAKSSS